MRLALPVTRLAICLGVLSSYCQAATIIHAGRLIDGRGGPVQKEMSLVIDEGRITRVAKGYVAPRDGDRLIKLVDHSVLPGMMDMHTHLM